MLQTGVLFLLFSPLLANGIFSQLQNSIKVDADDKTFLQDAKNGNDSNAKKLLQKLEEQLKNESWDQNPKELVESLHEFMEIECQIADRQKHKYDGSDQGNLAVFQEAIDQWCKNQNGDQIVVEELIEKVTKTFEEEGPKLVERLEEAEKQQEPIRIGEILEEGTSAEELVIRVEGGTERGDKLHNLVVAGNLLRMLEAKMGPGPLKEVLGSVLNKEADSTRTGVVMPSDMVKLVVELWTKVVLPLIHRARQQQQPSQSRSLGRRKRRFLEKNTINYLVVFGFCLASSFCIIYSLKAIIESIYSFLDAEFLVLVLAIILFLLFYNDPRGQKFLKTRKFQR